jgi:hypothetical protein
MICHFILVVLSGRWSYILRVCLPAISTSGTFETRFLRSSMLQASTLTNCSAALLLFHRSADCPLNARPVYAWCLCWAVNALVLCKDVPKYLVMHYG